MNRMRWISSCRFLTQRKEQEKKLLEKLLLKKDPTSYYKLVAAGGRTKERLVNNCAGLVDGIQRNSVQQMQNEAYVYNLIMDTDLVCAVNWLSLLHIIEEHAKDGMKRAVEDLVTQLKDSGEDYHVAKKFRGDRIVYSNMYQIVQILLRFFSYAYPNSVLKDIFKARFHAQCKFSIEHGSPEWRQRCFDAESFGWSLLK